MLLPIKSTLLIWSLILITCEILSFFLIPLYQSRHFQNAPAAAATKNILVMSDMQLSDKDTYRIRTTPITQLFLFTERYYAKRMYYATLQHVLAPALRLHEQWWLGDYWDWTLVMTDALFAEFAPQLWRYYGKRDETYLKKSIIVPGNHDIGTLASSVGEHRMTRARNALGIDSFSGFLDYPDEKVRVVWINSVHLLPEPGAYAHKMAREAWQFIDQVGRTPLPSPEWKTVLLSHIPLYHDEGHNCHTPFKKHASISMSMGFNYRNVLMQSETRDILDQIRPSLVLSGDHHFICKYNHSGTLRGEWPASGAVVPEHTLGAAGLLGGNTFPSVAVVQLPSLQVTHVFLPPTVAFHFGYGVYWVGVVVFSVVALVFPIMAVKLRLCSKRVSDLYFSERLRDWLQDALALAAGGLGLYVTPFVFWELYFGFMSRALGVEIG